MRESTDSKIKQTLKYNKCLKKFKVCTKEEEIINSVITKAMKDKTIKVRLNEIYNYDKSTYIHSMDVAILSLMIGISRKLDIGQLSNLCKSAMLHDYGKTKIPIEIINKPSRIDVIEREIVEAHPALGTYFLKDDGLEESTLFGIYEHHESYNGTEHGYPRKLIKNEIHEFGRIISVADKVDAYTTKRVYHGQRSFSDLIDYIYSNEDIDPEVVEQLFSRVTCMREVLNRNQKIV